MRICENGIYRDMTAEEIEALKAATENKPEPIPDETEQLRQRMEMLEECLLEMSMEVYA